MLFRKILSTSWLFFSLLTTLYSADTFAVNWQYAAVRRADNTEIDVDYDSVHQEDGLLIYDLRYPALKGLASFFSDVTYKIEKYAV